MDTPRPPRPTRPLRGLLLLVLAVATVVLLLAALLAADTALSVWQRLREAPAWLGWSVVAAIGALLGGSSWLGWRLWRGPGGPEIAAVAPTRHTIESRLEQLEARAAGVPERAELHALDARAAGGELHVGVFGRSSTGKSSLVRALAGREDLAVDVRGGTTREVGHARAMLADGRELVLADLPGLAEPGAPALAATARAEAIRAHALVYVLDGDITREEASELEVVLALGKPTVVALNKRDRYDPAERAALLQRLRERMQGRAAVVGVSAGGVQEIERVDADGQRAPILRERPREMAALLEALVQLTAPGAAGLEPARQSAVLASLDQRLAASEASLRAQDAAAAVRKYTRRAVVGALAAVAPGTDLIIQGALATALLRELTALYGLGLRDVDLDRFIERAGGTVRTATSITLAIAGNAMKAFPGLGTLGGGLVHAVAYGLVFDSLGRAVAATLAERGTLDPAATLARLDHDLRAVPSASRVGDLLRIAREVGSADREAR
jgi:GTP-binding protein EngB required for normal cell division